MIAMPKHPLHERIGKHQIRRVAVVDDAFDPVSLESLQEGEEQEFIDAVNEEDALLSEFHSVVTGIESTEVIQRAALTNEVVGLLWEKRQTLGELRKTLSSTLFRVVERKISQVEMLCKFLKDELKIQTVETFGTGSARPNEPFDIAFIDYRFGPSRQHESVVRAVEWATHLYHNGRTFIVLMSSESEAKERQELFRKNSKLTRGLFEFVAKEEIEDNGKFCNRLNSFCAGLDTRHEIHQFATAADAAVEEAVAALRESIHALGLEDYAYLEQISLREDGHPLGDYMLWLFGEFFAHKLAVNSALQPARKLANGLKYERFLPLQRAPSVMLAKMYSAAITEPVHEGWDPHPREVQEAADKTDTPAPEGTPAEPAAPAEDSTADDETAVTTGQELPSVTATVEPPAAASIAGPPSAKGTPPQAVPASEALQSGQAPSEEAAPSAKGMPLYQLGDLLIADKDKPAFLILNAGCDLQFSPGKRDCDPEQTILLVPGRFEPLHERGDETNVKRTELFELGEERFRIIWQHTRTIALPYYKVLPTHQPKGYDRRWRLKLPYALEVQQHFASQLTRVGVPTPTPVFRERPVEIYGKDAEGKCRHLGSIRDGIIVFHHRQRDQFVLTVDCLHSVLDHIDRYIIEVEAELRSAAAPTGTSEVPRPPATNASVTDTPVAIAHDAPKEAPHVSQKGARKEIVRDPVKEAAKRAQRRQKYVDELRELRGLLAHSCIFQDNLNDLPVLNGKLPQVEEIVKDAKPSTIVRLEIIHTAGLSGQFPSGAPIVLGFSLPDVFSAPGTVVQDSPPEEPERQPSAPDTEETTQP